MSRRAGEGVVPHAISASSVCSVIPASANSGRRVSITSLTTCGTSVRSGGLAAIVRSSASRIVESSPRALPRASRALRCTMSRACRVRSGSGPPLAAIRVHPAIAVSALATSWVTPAAMSAAAARRATASGRGAKSTRARSGDSLQAKTRAGSSPSTSSVPARPFRALAIRSASSGSSSFRPARRAAAASRDSPDSGTVPTTARTSPSSPSSSNPNASSPAIHASVSDDTGSIRPNGKEDTRSPAGDSRMTRAGLPASGVRQRTSPLSKSGGGRYDHGPTLRGLMRHHLLTGLFLAAFGAAGCAQGGANGGMDSGPVPAPDASHPEHDAGMPTMDVDGGHGGCPMTCPSGTICRGTSCVAGCTPDTGCEGGRACCDGACVNSDSSLTDCGSCGNACDVTANVCISGECKCGGGPACTGTDICCDGSCVDVANDSDACGGCGNHCDAGQMCAAGTCQDIPCDPACAPGETCSGGTCQCGTGGHCAAGAACCDDHCIDVESDTNNCGACGMVCPSGQVCMAGTCTADVPCDPSCNVGESCTGGACHCGSGGPCAAGLRCCGGECVDIQTNVGNCGACGRTCSGSQQCCTANCIDTGSDVNNCGACGHACDSGVANGCTSGSCTCDGCPPVRRPGHACVCRPSSAAAAAASASERSGERRLAADVTRNGARSGPARSLFCVAWNDRRCRGRR